MLCLSQTDIYPMNPQYPDLRRLHDFWNEKRGRRRMPAWKDVSVPELRPWLGHLNLLDVLDGGADFRFRVYGTKIAATFGIDHTGQRVSELPPSMADVLRSDYAEVCRTGRPVLVDRQRSAYEDFLRAEKLILPLSKDDTAPDMLLIGVYDGKPDRAYPGA